MTARSASVRLPLSAMVWCITCERAWRLDDLVGEAPDRRCPSAYCSDGAPGGLLPYREVRRLVAVRWPKEPVAGQRYALRSAGA